MSFYFQYKTGNPHSHNLSVRLSNLRSPIVGAYLLRLVYVWFTYLFFLLYIITLRSLCWLLHALPHFDKVFKDQDTGQDQPFHDLPVLIPRW